MDGKDLRNVFRCQIKADLISEDRRVVSLSAPRHQAHAPCRIPVRSARLETRPFDQRAIPSTRERFTERRSLRVEYWRLTSQRKDIAFACAHDPRYHAHRRRDESRAYCAGFHLQNFTTLSITLCCALHKTLRKPLRMESLCAFSTMTLVDFPHARHEASTLLYSMTKELRHSHQ
jgi:hypothetical protein